VALTPPNGEKLTDFLFGVGLNMDVNEDNMLVFALEYMNRKYEYANPDTVGGNYASTEWNYTPTVRLALESHITTWFTTHLPRSAPGERTDESNAHAQPTPAPGFR
jgi:hypothetical protein